MTKRTIEELKVMFRSGIKPTGSDFTDLIDTVFNTIESSHATERAPHQYGEMFEWRANPDTRSLDLVVLE